jgi:hypothetical protein
MITFITHESALFDLHANRVVSEAGVEICVASNVKSSIRHQDSVNVGREGTDFTRREDREPSHAPDTAIADPSIPL